MQTKDWSLRHRILGIPDTKSVTDFESDCFHRDDGRLHWFGGTEAFSDLSVDALHSLIDLGFLNPSDNTNDSPTAQAFLNFMEKYPMFTAIGYAVHPARFDVRIIIEGLETSAPIDALTMEAFTEFSKGATELDVKPDLSRCWWD